MKFLEGGAKDTVDETRRIVCTKSFGELYGFVNCYLRGDCVATFRKFIKPDAENVAIDGRDGSDGPFRGHRLEREVEFFEVRFDAIPKREHKFRIAKGLFVRDDIFREDFIEIRGGIFDRGPHLVFI